MPDRTSSLKDLFNLIAFSLTFFAGKNNRVETVACSSAGPGKTVSTTIAGTPDSRCSEAARPPSAAAAVRAWSKRTEPTRLSRAKSFSKVLTQGRVLSLESATN